MTKSSHIEDDSVEPLSNDIRTFRAKLVAHLMTPAPAGCSLNIDKVASLLSDKLEEACESFYDSGLGIEGVNADILHLTSFGDMVIMADGKWPLACLGFSTNPKCFVWEGLYEGRWVDG